MLPPPLRWSVGWLVVRAISAGEGSRAVSTRSCGGGGEEARALAAFPESLRRREEGGACAAPLAFFSAPLAFFSASGSRGERAAASSRARFSWARRTASSNALLCLNWSSSCLRSLSRSSAAETFSSRSLSISSSEKTISSLSDDALPKSGAEAIFPTLSPGSEPSSLENSMAGASSDFCSPSVADTTTVVAASSALVSFAAASSLENSIATSRESSESALGAVAAAGGGLAAWTAAPPRGESPENSGWSSRESSPPPSLSAAASGAGAGGEGARASCSELNSG
mmetsp:Transcript_5126/g.19003  ORF Transcript_5126/g.19003 Transcript_5126/m.19003 type:complete len:284 (+) Transcript_5126:703-1554(+)